MSRFPACGESISIERRIDALPFPLDLERDEVVDIDLDRVCFSEVLPLLRFLLRLLDLLELESDSDSESESEDEDEDEDEDMLEIVSK